MARPHRTALLTAIASLILGAIAATGFAPLDAWPLTLIGLAGLVRLIVSADTIRAALGRGWWFGVGHFTVNDNWFQHAFDLQTAMPPLIGYAAPVALALYLAIFPALAAAVAWRVRRWGRPSLVLVFAAAWIGTEWLRATVFTGYAWNPIAAIWLSDMGVARLAAWIGTYGLSGLTVLLAGLIAIEWRAAGIALGGLAVVGFSAVWTDAPAAAPDAPLVRIVQPGIGEDQIDILPRAAVIARMTSLSGRPGQRPRLIVWPEGEVRDFIEDSYPASIYERDPHPVRRDMTASLGPDDLLLAGSTALSFNERDRVGGDSNSVFVLDRTARIIARYDKAHLVPYGEYLPVPWLLKPLGLAQIVPGGDIPAMAGPGPRSLSLPPFGLVGVQICYEIIFSGQVIDAAHRPRLIVNPSNDAWFGAWGPPQHLAQAQLRAIEEGVPIVRSTPTGISALIAADGRVLASLELGHAGSIEAQLPPALPPTLFAKIGNWLALIIAAVLLGLAVASRSRAR